MKFKALIWFTVLLGALIFSVGLTHAQQQGKQTSRYTAIDLGTLGGTQGTAFGVNNLGWAGGAASLSGDAEEHALLWATGLKIDLGTFGGPNSQSEFAPNDFGQAAGFAETAVKDPLQEDYCSFGTHLICLAFLWQYGIKIPLPALGGNNSVGVGINNLGQVVGAAETKLHDSTCVAPQVLQSLPVVWVRSQVKALSPFTGDPEGTAVANNDLGEAVGYSGNCNSNVAAHALLWKNGTATNLGTFGGTMNNAAQDINNGGDVVGFSDLPGDTTTQTPTTHAFLWRNGVMSDLGTLPGDTSSYGEGINNLNQVVGVSCDADGNCRVFLWQGGTMTDVNSLLPSNASLYLVNAYGINDRGEIVGDPYQQSTGDFIPFLAIPNSGSETASPTAQPDSPKMTLPENVRTLAQQRIGRGRIKAGFNAPH